MEPKICPFRIGQAPNDDVLNEDGTVNKNHQCFGELCGWFVKNEEWDLAECAIMTIND